MKNSSTEANNRRKSLTVAILLHTALIAALIYPFLTTAIAEEQPYEVVMEIDFTQSAAAASADKKERNDVKLKKTEREAAPKNVKKPALPSTPAPPILTAPEPMPPVVDIPEPIEPLPDPKPTMKPETSPAPVKVVTPTAKPGTPASQTDAKGTSNGKGTATGSPETGDGATVADAGGGLAPIGSALEGDGVLGRSVVYRPSLDDVVKQNGTIVLNICINQRGRVIGVKWNEERSTITDTDLVRSAIAKAKQYTFEKDYTAPARECGALSIVINGL